MSQVVHNSPFVHEIRCSFGDFDCPNQEESVLSNLPHYAANYGRSVGRNAVSSSCVFEKNKQNGLVGVARLDRV